jgi:DNA ligase-1
MKLKTLYKRSVNKKILQWEIEIEGACFRTISGYTDGLKVVSEWTCCEAKNVGKKNATTAEQQALAEATAMHRKRMETGSFESISEIDTPIYFKPMLAKKWEDYKDKIKYPVASQKKYDGVRCIIHSGGMFSRNGKELLSAPHILKSLESFFEKHPDIILDGELYTDKEFDFNKIISCVRKLKPEPQDLVESKEYIKYFIYDIASSNEIFQSRYNSLKEMYDNKEFPDTCVISNIDLIYNENEIQIYHDKYISEGFEGQIIRILDGKYENKRSNFLLKNKVFDDAEFIIRDVKEGVGKLSGKVGKLVFDNFESAVNGEHSYLEELWLKKESLIGLEATVRYFGLTTTEIPVPRFPKVILIDRNSIE